MQKRLLLRYLFLEIKGGPDILQKYQWTCNIYYREPNKHNKKYSVLESHRKGVTTGIGDHLKTYRIIKDTHNV
jgi:hypothetical protein